MNPKNLLGSMPAWENRTLPGWSYKLRDSACGLDVQMAGRPDMDEGRMSVWIPFADGNRRDGVGDLLEVGGIRTDRHVHNPVALFDHGKHVQLPIGLTQDRDTKSYTVQLDPVTQRARANVFFYQGKGNLLAGDGAVAGHGLFCEQLYHMMAEELIRAGSIGYQVINAKQMPADPSTGTPPGLHLLTTLLLEVSAVVMPANMDTVRKVLATPRMCGKSLSPILVKSLEPYEALYTKTTVGFVTGVPDVRSRYRRLGRVQKSGGENHGKATEASMAEMKRRVKALPPGEDEVPDEAAPPPDMAGGAVPGDQPPPPPADAGGEVEETEKYGAQVLRRVHQDFTQLMQDYDEMRGPLENMDVDGHLEQILISIEQHMTATEELFSEAYADLEGLEGAPDAKDMDGDGEMEGDVEPSPDDEGTDEEVVADDAVPADSAPENEPPTGDEALEGMEEDGPGEKALRLKRIKSMRTHYKKKGSQCACGTSPCSCKGGCKNCKGKKAAPGYEEHQEKPGSQTDPTPEGNPGHEEHGDKPGKEGDPTPDVDPGSEEHEDEDPGETTDTVTKFQDHEKGYITEGADYLGEIAKPNSLFEEEHRMKAYHYYKTFEGMAQIGRPTPSAPSTGTKSEPGSEQWAEEERSEPAHQQPPGRKTCGEASKFFRELATTKLFGDGHRTKAANWHKELKEMVGGTEGGQADEEGMQEQQDATMEEGAGTDVGAMDAKALRAMCEEQNRKIQQMGSLLNKLAKTV